MLKFVRNLHWRKKLELLEEVCRSMPHLPQRLFILPWSLKIFSKSFSLLIKYSSDY
jgi:hypothetical protein